MRTFLGLVIVFLGIGGSNPAAGEPFAVPFPQVTVTSDYRYFGISSSDREPAVQPSLYIMHPDNWYSGIWASNVDFLAPGSPSYEIDVYVGRRFEFASSKLSVEGMGTFFPDNDLPGPTLNFFQGIAKYEHKVGPATMRAETAWSPNGSTGVGDQFRLEGGIDLQTEEWLTVGGMYGTVRSQRGQSRRYWEAALTARTQQFAFDIRYVDTNLERSQCFFTDWCEPTVIGSITWNVPIGGWRYSGDG